MSKDGKLAVNGGEKVRVEPMPIRALFGIEEKEAAMRVFDEAISSGSAFSYNGPHEQEYEKAFCDYLGGGFADGVSSGTSAVFCALGALQLDVASEVIVPPITDPGGMMPVVMLNCIPVVADTTPNSYNMGAKQILEVLTERTRAIIVAHIAGEPADMDPIMEIARARNIPVIEDCAQAHGARYKGRLVGTIGDIAAFSTMSGKHHATGGQGGVVYTRNEELHWKEKRFADRGKPFNIPDQKGNVVLGLNLNLNELSAAIGVVQLKKLNSIVERRRRVAEAIKEQLKKLKTVSVGYQVPGAEASYWFMRIHFKADKVKVDKATFVKAAYEEGIQGLSTTYRPYFPTEMPWYINRAAYGKSGCPWTCPFYKGERNRVFLLSNAIAVTNSDFNIGINENYGEKEANDIVNAFKKVEQAYLK